MLPHLVWILANSATLRYSPEFGTTALLKFVCSGTPDFAYDLAARQAIVYRGGLWVLCPANDPALPIPLWTEPVTRRDAITTARLGRDRQLERSVAGRAHLIGIGGAGMRAIADLLRQRGWQVSGSDLAPLPPRLGGQRGHAAEHVPHDADLVVYSDAVPAENCERLRAEALGLKPISYPQMLARLTAGLPTLAVAGTHGKSTTTALAAEILIEAGLDPTVVCGAAPSGRSSGGRAGEGGLVLVEACEYRANFLHLTPDVSVILPIEPDHFDAFPTFDSLVDTFTRFSGQTASSGLLLVAGDCPTALRATARSARRRETFGLGPEATWRAVDLHSQSGCYAFRLEYRGQTLTHVQLQVPGHHQVENALAAAALALSAGADVAAARRGLEGFRGLQRRLEPVGSFAGVAWIDDYAHHPTEIRAGLATLREVAPDARLWCVFQPHQASRTAALVDELAESLHNADKVFVTEIFRAREGPPAPGEVKAADLAAKARWLGADVAAVHRPTDVGRAIASAVEHGELTAGDVVVTMGAGTIGSLGHELIERFRERRAAG